MGTVAVTGSASGIGAATRARLLQQGHRVIGVDVVADADGVDVLADLSTGVGRQAAIDGVLAACEHRLDGLVTAAGVPPRVGVGPVVSVNYFGTTALLAGLQPALAAGGRGRAVAVSSVMASTGAGLPDLVEVLLTDDDDAAQRWVASYDGGQPLRVYAATKVAVARWVRRRAPTPEWAHAGIRLNAIAPGATRTQFFAAQAGDERNERIPVGFAATPDQIAAWIVLMLGDDADFLCGSVVYVDGGTDARRNPDAWPRPAAGGAVAGSRMSRLRRLLRRG